MRTRPNRWLVGVLAFAAMMVALVACGGDDPTPTPPPAATPTPADTMMEDPTPTPADTMDGDGMTEDPTPTPADSMDGDGMTEAPTPTPVPDPTATPTPPPGFDAAEYFSGQTIRIVANSSPGGGTDTQGRVMAAFMSRYIPGNPRVVFTNQPNKPLEYLEAATRAPKDGTYISWNSTPQLDFGFNESTNNIKRSTFQAVGSTIDSTRGWYLFEPVKNLGPSAANSCLWDYAGQSSTGGGEHNAFRLADEISDVRDGNPTFLANVYVSEQLDVPFEYYAFETVDTNAVRTMWAQGIINSTVRSSLWYRFPVENPGWLENGTIRVMAGMGPNELKPNSWGEPHCGDVREHLNDDQRFIFNTMHGPTNYASKALWLPPGTPDHIADALSAAFEEALTTDPDLIQKYSDVAGESPGWTGRAELQAATLENENLFAGGQAIIAEQAERLVAKYFPEFVSGG